MLAAIVLPEILSCAPAYLPLFRGICSRSSVALPQRPKARRMPLHYAASYRSRPRSARGSLVRSGHLLGPQPLDHALFPISSPERFTGWNSPSLPNSPCAGRIQPFQVMEIWNRAKEPEFLAAASRCGWRHRLHLSDPVLRLRPKPSQHANHHSSTRNPASACHRGAPAHATGWTFPPAVSWSAPAPQACSCSPRAADHFGRREPDAGPGRSLQAPFRAYFRRAGEDHSGQSGYAVPSASKKLM